MNFAVLQFPASNCDQDAVHALRDVLGHSARYVWHKETSLCDADAVMCRVDSATAITSVAAPSRGSVP